ncbi:aminoglycoside phosphotransferase family protein [Paenibacillus allorhizosphaerae]|uniref:Aminoglycoside phosphotransferase domain-containing protein n=1 Tax=Paenibacillus allorhizosphaerae TaxID=2849866 RepID=A0ABM8VIX6_9BACL|nr:aminoglycoside phosphotransferase family protein [Paenibacillus allorhizosphaerae]CAG7644536.1 hypothetical protein PAECIP111802_03301 [Paenibacillus allorhizosphaerae]
MDPSIDSNLITLLSDIRRTASFDNYEFLLKGHSNAKKVILFQSGEPVYLLRVYDADSFARRSEEYDYLERHYNHGVNCQKPVAIGLADELKLCYLLLTYTEGQSGEEALPGLSPESQYMQGVEAGKQLRIIHIVEPKVPFRWADKRYGKYVNKKEVLRELNLNFYKQHEIESFIERHFHLLESSPVRFQHDDFHPANMIFKDGRLNGIIDFSRFDWGDPWEEFFKLPKYTCCVSKPFARGQVQGYFDGRIPDEFWLKYHLFVALNQHATLIGGYQSQRVEETQEKIQRTIQSHNFADGGPPSWFICKNFFS